jgi:hypothetical protein
LKILHTEPQRTTWKYSYIRAVGRTENLEGGKYLCVGHNSPPCWGRVNQRLLKNSLNIKKSLG